MKVRYAMKVIDQITDRVVLHWGEMARNWGISKTMGQIHALLYVHGGKLSAEEIMEALAISRGNVSMSLRELVHWGLVYRVHERGERREFYHAEQDVWEIFNRIIAERKKREVDPTIATLCECCQLIESSGEPADELLARIENLREFFEAMNSFHQRFTPRSRADVDRVTELVPIKVEGL